RGVCTICLRLHGEHPANFVGLQSDRHRSYEARQDGCVVELLNHPGYAEPMHGVTRAQIDDQQSAPRLRAFARELQLEPQTGERAVAAWHRQPDDGVIAVEGEAARVAGTENYFFELASLAIHVAEPAVP